MGMGLGLPQLHQFIPVLRSERPQGSPKDLQSRPPQKLPEVFQLLLPTASKILQNLARLEPLLLVSKFSGPQELPIQVRHKAQVQVLGNPLPEGGDQLLRILG